jgi:hypothetical protein
MKELYALYNPSSNRFVTTDRSYEMLKSIQFVLSHKILLYCVRVSDVENYRDGLLDKDRHHKIGLADHKRINIAVDIHPKSENYIKLVANTDVIDDFHLRLSGVVNFFKDFIGVFNKEYGFFQDHIRIRSRNQKMHLEQLGEFMKLLVPSDDDVQELIKWETDYKFSIMKYMRSYKGQVVQMLYNDVDIEQDIATVKQQVRENFIKLPHMVHPARYVQPKVTEWLNANT